MATQIKISELPLANESALSLAADDRLIFNNDNINTQTIKFANFVDAVCAQDLKFTGNCQFTQKIVGPDGGDIQVGLDDLVDVQFQNVTSGQIITYSGTQWINRDVADIALQKESLSVVISDTPSGGGSLAYDSATGVFTFTPANEGTFTQASLSVVNGSAAVPGGSLAYNPSTAVFTFSPADSYAKAETYSKNEVDTALAAKANTADVYTKSETDSALGAKATADVVGVTGAATNLGDFSGSIIDSNQSVKQALQQVETAVETNATNIAALPAAGDSYTKAEADTLLDAKVDIDGGLTVTTTVPSGTGSLAYNDDGTFTFQPADLTGYALLANPTFTGAPSAPTAVASTNTTQIATTEFVTSAVAALDAAALRGLLGIKEGADAGAAGAASGEVFFNTGSSTYVVAA